MTMLDDVAAIMEAIRNERRTLLVSRELEEPVTRLVEASWLSGFLAVKTSPNLSEGSVYLVDERALRADLDRPLRVEFEPAHYAPASVERVRIVEESVELGGCDALRDPLGYSRVSTWCAATEGTTA